jgi:hypothetical protein
MSWEVEYTDEFEKWWNSLSLPEQEAIDTAVDLLGRWGPNLRFPHSSGVAGSRHSHMRELRVQCNGQPYRVLYAFNPLRTAILLIGGNKAGQGRWHEQWIPVADRLYDEHLDELRKDGSNGKKV